MPLRSMSRRASDSMHLCRGITYALRPPDGRIGRGQAGGCVRNDWATCASFGEHIRVAAGCRENGKRAGGGTREKATRTSFEESLDGLRRPDRSRRRGQEGGCINIYFFISLFILFIYLFIYCYCYLIIISREIFERAFSRASAGGMTRDKGLRSQVTVHHGSGI